MGERNNENQEWRLDRGRNVKGMTYKVESKNKNLRIYLITIWFLVLSFKFLCLRYRENIEEMREEEGW